MQKTAELPFIVSGGWDRPILAITPQAKVFSATKVPPDDLRDQYGIKRTRLGSKTQMKIKQRAANH